MTIKSLPFEDISDETKLPKYIYERGFILSVSRHMIKVDLGFLIVTFIICCFLVEKNGNLLFPFPTRLS
jgi:hypothetical protein